MSKPSGAGAISIQIQKMRLQTQESVIFLPGGIVHEQSVRIASAP
jgi:hypothetical protein